MLILTRHRSKTSPVIGGPVYVTVFGQLHPRVPIDVPSREAPVFRSDLRTGVRLRCAERRTCNRH